MKKRGGQHKPKHLIAVSRSVSLPQYVWDEIDTLPGRYLAEKMLDLVRIALIRKQIWDEMMNCGTETS